MKYKIGDKVYLIGHPEWRGIVIGFFPDKSTINIKWQYPRGNHLIDNTVIAYYLETQIGLLKDIILCPEYLK